MPMTLAQMVADARAKAREITPAEAAQAAENGELDLIVDVREPAEYRERHVPRAINIRAECLSSVPIQRRREPTLR